VWIKHTADVELAIIDVKCHSKDHTFPLLGARWSCSISAVTKALCLFTPAIGNAIEGATWGHAVKEAVPQRFSFLSMLPIAAFNRLH
jgi:hypothetical protein